MNHTIDTVKHASGTYPHERTAYPRYVLVILTLVGILSWVDRQVFSIVLESIKREFEFSDTQLGLVGGIAFGLFYAAVGLPVAALADRSNRKNIVAGALALWSGMTAVCGMATGFGSLFLARMGLGIGEAGSSPPSQSLVSDYFPPERRGFAMGVLYTYVPLGYVVAFSVGGWLNYAYGWRSTFLALGLPGLLLAAVVYSTVREPRRGNSETVALAAAGQPPSLFATLRFFLKRPSLRHITIGGAVHGLGAFGAAVWLPAFFMRKHGMNSAEIGAQLALIMGTAGLAGTLLGGYLADRVAARTGDFRWYMKLPGTMLLVSIPFTVLMYFWPSSKGALILYVLPVLSNHMILGPVVASLQNLAGVRRRAMAAAFYLFLVNLISMGAGPLIIGIISDVLGTARGAESLRVALVCLVSVSCAWAAIHFLIAARSMRQDLSVAQSP